MSQNHEIPGHRGLDAEVREGMAVVEHSGAEVGTIEVVYEADPQELPGTEPDLAPKDSAELMQGGFVKIAGTGLLSGDCYARSDQIERIEAGVVHLTVNKDELLKRRHHS